MKKKTLKILAAGFTAILSLQTGFALYTLSKLKKIKGNYKTSVIQNDKKISLTGQEFSGDSLLIAFGAYELDLRGAIPTSQFISLTIKAMYSGVKIIVPEGWSVKGEGKTFLGGFTNKCKVGQEGLPHLIIQYDISFAGVEVINGN
ncbi:MAG TPA: hypothetical protein VK921_08795 [Anditalea sp.]|nr:hypothetical protein [Anditalea sp.]